MFILDTDHISLLERTTSTEAQRLDYRLEQVDPQQIATTIITYEEQTQGWLSYAAGARTLVQQVTAYKRLSRHLDLYRRIRVLEFDERAATEFQRLRQSRIRIGTMDLKIAAVVLAHDATLLSRNLRDFHKVPGLRVEDWTL
jgi:tRNA(fMet)-specific endonuclease VapC